MEQLALLLVLGMLAVALVVLWGNCSSGKRSRLPPGPRPVPIFGNMFLFAASKSWHRDFWKLADKYGPIMWLRLGSHGALMVQSPDLAMGIPKNQDTIFCSRPPPGYSVALFTDGGKDVRFSPVGHYWRFARKLLSSGLLTTKRLHDFQHMREQELERLVEALKSHIGQPADLGNLLRVLNTNIITRMGFGKAVANYQVEGPPVEKGTGGAKSSVTDQGIGDAVPWLGFLDNFLLPKAKMQHRARQIRGYYEGILQEHRQHLKAHPGYQPRDFADVLLVTPSESDGQLMTDDLIIPQFYDLIGGGIETVSSTMEWTMAELLRQPSVLQQAVAELEQVVGSSRAVKDADIPNLPYLHAVVKETFRMHPPTPFLIPHYSTQATTVGGYHVPANTTVFVNVWALGRNPASWPDPDNFRPERFIYQRPELDVQGHHFDLLPFGAGKRICPGHCAGPRLPATYCRHAVAYLHLVSPGRCGTAPGFGHERVAWHHHSQGRSLSQAPKGSLL